MLLRIGKHFKLELGRNMKGGSLSYGMRGRDW